MAPELLTSHADSRLAGRKLGSFQKTVIATFPLLPGNLRLRRTDFGEIRMHHPANEEAAGLVEMRDDRHVLTVAGQNTAWEADGVQMCTRLGISTRYRRY
jgi:hypothetical protein